jgi:hypothetical protein
MKRLSSLLAVVLLTVLAAPCSTQAASRPTNDDTIMVKLPNKATMTLVTKNKAQLTELRTYHLDSLMIMLDSYISQADAASKNASNKAVTMEFYPAKDHPGTNAPEEVRITVRAEANTSTKTTTKVGRFITVSVDDDKKNDKNDDINITIGSNRGDKAQSDSLKAEKSRRKREEHANKVVHSNVNIDLGLNTLVGRSPWKDVNGVEQDFDLKPTGSRYISLNYLYDIRVGGKGSPLHLITGPQLSFNNYMFDKNRRLFATDSRTDILREPTLSRPELQGQKGPQQLPHQRRGLRRLPPQQPHQDQVRGRRQHPQRQGPGLL